MPIFDGANKLITLDAPTGGILNVSVEQDLYSDWKEWVLLSDNAKFLPAFSNSVGGDPLGTGLNAGAYFFLNNDIGWRIISSDEDQEARYFGNLVPIDVGLPIIIPTPGRTVLHLGLQPITQGTVDVLRELNVIRQIVGGRAVVSVDDLTITVYDEDDITILRTFSISADGRLRDVTFKL
jgi:hypothetical protein